MDVLRLRTDWRTCKQCLAHGDGQTGHLIRLVWAVTSQLHRLSFNKASASATTITRHPAAEVSNQNINARFIYCKEIYLKHNLIVLLLSGDSCSCRFSQSQPNKRKIAKAAIISKKKSSYHRHGGFFPSGNAHVTFREGVSSSTAEAHWFRAITNLNSTVPKTRESRTLRNLEPNHEHLKKVG